MNSEVNSRHRGNKKKSDPEFKVGSTGSDYCDFLSG
jgi:hypothetical protein